MLMEDLLQGLGEMAQEMQAIGDLGGGGGSMPCPVGGRAVARDHLAPRMVLEPLRQRVALAVWEERHGLAAFQVHEDGAIRVAFPHCPIIHAQDPGRREVWLRLSVQQPQERVPAHPQVPRVAEAYPGFAAQGDAEGDQALGESQGAARPGGGHGGPPFGEDTTRTGAIATQPRADAQLEAHPILGPGQIGAGALVVTMDAPGRGSAQRTGHAGLPRAHAQGTLCRGIIDLTCLKAQARGIREQTGKDGV
jgi:hypothetical protein